MAGPVVCQMLSTSGALTAAFRRHNRCVQKVVEGRLYYRRALHMSIATASSSAQQSADNPAHMEHQHTNRLAKEQSPYLLQHAHNPVSLCPLSPLTVI
jgi:hypothetical protein